MVALRYNGEHFLFDPAVIGGRSHCPKCGRRLTWYELIPIVSFVIQRARCRGCKARIGFRYVAMELFVGLLFAAVPIRLAGALPTFTLPLAIFAGLWILVFALLTLISYVDIRLNIIPDECHWMLGVLALGIVIVSIVFFGPVNRSLLGPYAWILGLQGSPVVAHLAGAVFGFAFFELLVLITRGRGMGMGDVKLALPLGFLFGWPDILGVFGSAFIIGAIIGSVGIALRKKTMKATLPFAPFLAIGAAVIFFFGFGLVGWYVKLLGI